MSVKAHHANRMGRETEERRGPHANALCAQRRRHRGDEFRRAARKIIAGSGSLRSGARPDDHPRQHPSHQSRADVHRGGLQLQDQFQHRKFGDHVQHRRGAGETSLLRQVRRRHGDGSLHRRRYSAHPPGHPQRFPRSPSAPCRSTKPSAACAAWRIFRGR